MTDRVQNGVDCRFHNGRGELRPECGDQIARWDGFAHVQGNDRPGKESARLRKSGRIGDHARVGIMFRPFDGKPGEWLVNPWA